MQAEHRLIRLFAALIIIFAGLALNAQTTRRVLFLGNSYTAVNDLPGTISQIAKSKGDTLEFDSNTPGGYTFQMHATDAASISKIYSAPWDVVVLQEQSQLPSFPPSQVAASVYPFADSLTRMIRDNDSCTLPMFYMTWGRKNGDQQNCAAYPPVCTYYGMQMRLRTSYLEMGQMFDAAVAPAGMAWKKTRDTQPGIELYMADESHPSLAGTYLVACTFYASIFHKDPQGCYIPAGVDSIQAAAIQDIAGQIVPDSLGIWNIDTVNVHAGFSYLLGADSTVQFTNLSLNASSYFWDFGDGGTSAAVNPSHTFPLCGTSYIVKLRADNDCKTDTHTMEVFIPCVGMDDPAIPTGWEVFPNPAVEVLHICCPPPLADAIALFDIRGKCLVELTPGKDFSGDIRLTGLTPGLYLIKIYNQGGTISRKLIVGACSD